MTNLRCLSCKAVYPSTQQDGSPVRHVCPSGTENPRNENVHPALFFYEGKAMRRLPAQGGRAQWEPWGGVSTLIAEGAGVEVVAQDAP